MTEFDELMKTGVGTGVYQISVLIIACIFNFLSIDGIAINFLAARMNFKCSEYNETASHYPSLPNVTNITAFRNESRTEKCNVVSMAIHPDNTSTMENQKCHQWSYNRSVYVSTIVSEFDLVCDKLWLVDFVSTSYMAGRLLSTLVHGYLSDRFGRKKVLFGSHVIKLIGGVMSLYSYNYITYVISRFIIAVGTTASCLASFVLLIEVVGKNWRRRFGIIFNFSVALGGMILSLVAYLVRDFRHLQAIYTFPQVTLLLCYFILDESPRWLATQKKIEQARKVVTKITLVNCNSDIIEQSTGQITFESVTAGERTSKSSFLNCNGFFYDKVIATKSAILWLSWFVVALIYYAISLNIGRLPGSIYLNNFLITLVELPANGVTILAVEKLGGRRTLAVFTILSAVTCFATIPLMSCESCEYAITALGILGKGLITVSYNTLYVETAETYPTKIRSQAMGVSASFGRLSSMSSSFLGGAMADLWRPLPSLIFGSLALLSGGLFVIFPRKNTSDMPESDIKANENIHPQNKYGCQAVPMVSTIEKKNRDDVIA